MSIYMDRSGGKSICMQAFVQKLKDMGYDDVKLIDTTSGMFMNYIVLICFQGGK